MRRSEVKEAFQEFRRLKKVVDGSTLSPEDDTDARISLWNQVKLLREQVETYRESNLELLTSEEQQELDAVECARVLHTPLLRARSISTSSDKSPQGIITTTLFTSEKRNVLRKLNFA